MSVSCITKIGAHDGGGGGGCTLANSISACVLLDFSSWDSFFVLFVFVLFVVFIINILRLLLHLAMIFFSF